MYEDFYGMRERPFALLPDASYLFLSKGHGTALTLLRYSILNRQGFTVVSGEVGSGKTTLINRLLDELKTGVTVGLINYTSHAFGDMGEWIMMAYGLPYKGKSKVELYDDFVQFMIREYAAGRPVVLIVDEAQNLGISGLEEIRMLSNVNAQKDYLLHVILVGQPELRSLLQSRQLRQLTQRVSVAYHLNRLTDEEVARYIVHRVTLAGGSESLFSPEAIRLIAAASDGIPRLVNTFCDLALVYAYSEGMRPCECHGGEAVLARSVADGVAGGGGEVVGVNAQFIACLGIQLILIGALGVRANVCRIAGIVDQTPIRIWNGHCAECRRHFRHRGPDDAGIFHVDGPARRFRPPGLPSSTSVPQAISLWRHPTGVSPLRSTAKSTIFGSSGKHLRLAERSSVRTPIPKSSFVCMNALASDLWSNSAACSRSRCGMSARNFAYWLVIP
jgi:type II secretory pathway predicted ATPase ExeA